MDTTTEATSKAFDEYFAGITDMEREACYGQVVNLIAAAFSKGAARRGTFSVDPATKKLTLVRYRDGADFLKRIVADHGIRLGMRDGAPIVEDSVWPTAPQKSKGRPRRTDPSKLEKLVCEHSEQMSLERLAKVLDAEGVPLPETLEEKKVQSWWEAVKKGCDTRHAVQKRFSSIRKQWSEKRPF